MTHHSERSPPVQKGWRPLPWPLRAASVYLQIYTTNLFFVFLCVYFIFQPYMEMMPAGKNQRRTASSKFYRLQNLRADSLNYMGVFYSAKSAPAWDQPKELKKKTQPLSSHWGRTAAIFGMSKVSRALWARWTEDRIHSRLQNQRGRMRPGSRQTPEKPERSSTPLLLGSIWLLSSNRTHNFPVSAAARTATASPLTNESWKRTRKRQLCF